MYDLKPETRSLGTIVEQAGSFHPCHALEIARRLCMALAAGFDFIGISHLNLSPKNVRISPDMALQIFDYGISERLLADHTLLSFDFDVWSHKYCAPEIIQLKTHYGPKSDLYSIGALLHLMLTGVPPHGNLDLVQSINAPPSDPRTFNPAVPDAAAALTCHMLEHTPAMRPSGWADAAAKFQTVIQEVTPPVNASEVLTNTNPFRRLPKGKVSLECEPVPQKGRRMPGHTPGAKQKTSIEIKHKTSSGHAVSKATLQKTGTISTGAVKTGGNSTALWLIGGIIFAAIMLAIAYTAMHKKPEKPSRKQGVAKFTNPAQQQKADATPSEPAARSDTLDSQMKTDTPAEQPPPTQSAVPIIPAAPTTPIEMLKAADAYAKANPEDFDSIIGKYTAAAEEARNQRKLNLFGQIEGKISAIRAKYSTSLADLSTRVNNEIGPLVRKEEYQEAYAVLARLKSEQKQQEAIGRIDKATLNIKIMEMRKTAAALLKSDGFEKALQYVTNYSGDLVEETRAERAKLAAEMLAEDLRKSAKKLVAEGKLDEAKDFLLNYSGPLAEETVATRETMVKKIPELVAEAASESVKYKVIEALASFEYDDALRLLDSIMPNDPKRPAAPSLKELRAEVAADKAAAITDLSPVFDIAASPIATLDFAAAERILSAAVDKLAGQKTAALSLTLYENIKAARNFDTEALRLLTKAGRKEITYLESDVERAAIVTEIKDGKLITIQAEGGKGPQKQKPVPPEKLSLRIKLELANSLGLKNSRLLKGMLSWRDGEFGKARAHFSAVPAGLGGKIIQLIDELSAERSLLSLFEKNGLPYTKGLDDDFIKRLEKAPMPPDKGKRITAELQRIKTAHPDSKFLANISGILEAVQKKCQRKDAVDTETKFEISVKDGAEFANAIKDRPPANQDQTQVRCL